MVLKMVRKENYEFQGCQGYIIKHFFKSRKNMITRETMTHFSKHFVCFRKYIPYFSIIVSYYEMDIVSINNYVIKIQRTLNTFKFLSS
jgi:hypothetical protein